MRVMRSKLSLPPPPLPSPLTLLSLLLLARVSRAVAIAAPTLLISARVGRGSHTQEC